jgi:two-component system OmpR family sensor kinase
MSWSGAGTFRFRLMVAMTFLSLAVLALASFAIYFGVRQTLRSNLDRALLSIARTEVSSAFDAPGGVHVHEEASLGLALGPGDGYEKLALIKDEQGRVVAHTANLGATPSLQTDAAREARAFAGQASFADLRHEEDLYRAIYYPLGDVGSDRMFALVAVPKKPLHHSLEVLQVVLALCLLVAGTMAALGASRLARHLTRPLERIAEATSSIGEHNLDVRIPEVSGDAELRTVIAGLNDMLARLRQSFLDQQRLVTDASHELRSPLSNLRGTIEVAMRRPRSVGDHEETLASSLQEIDRLSRLVDALLTLSRADAGQLLPHSVRCDLVLIAEQSAAAHRARATARNVEIRVQAAGTAPVSGDAERLRQVVDNLVDNAVRYAPEGSTVVVTTQAANGQATLAVHDEGLGLSAEEQEHVFDRFYRADSSRARSTGGTGLGLAIAKAIVEAHGGRLSVQSWPGGGTTFSMVLSATTSS